MGIDLAVGPLAKKFVRHGIPFFAERMVSNVVDNDAREKPGDYGMGSVSLRRAALWTEQQFVTERALLTLSDLLGPGVRELQGILENSYFHDWQSDPFSLGAYSYGKVGSDGGQRAIAAPLENTVFFAGEATDTAGHNGTVHAAIASGYRAAKEIQQSVERINVVA